jgi:8-oxo-dGTP pyrophosphatase MutT (NUDIX family)
MRLPTQVLVYVVRIVNGEREYLLLRRVASRGSFWQGVTGGAEVGEEPLDAALRELGEETGLVPSEMLSLDYSYSFPLEDSWRHLYADDVKEITEWVFVAVIDGEQLPLLNGREHDQWRWCTLDAALSLLTWPGNIEALKRCDRFLAQR